MSDPVQNVSTFFLYWMHKDWASMSIYTRSGWKVRQHGLIKKAQKIFSKIQINGFKVKSCRIDGYKATVSVMLKYQKDEPNIQNHRH